MSTLEIIIVGKNKDQFFDEMTNYYLKQIKKPQVRIHYVKSYKEDVSKEGLAIFEKIKEISGQQKHYNVLLAEQGKTFSSQDFSQWIFKKIENGPPYIFFIIGGAAGHGEKIKQAADFELSLSPMTFPHKWAKIIFIEQIFRAVAIKNNHPYHK